ncbi:hypothetical protein RSOLAG1IB_01620 [Rhizoctonia solani AG-1 IB]|uniref:GST N-terminal domain-containing protein n=1 Tax=Thanatephorus cucumeris (strain AG1-IB / isolate 7/3/14) TaxID=1108050 RepID=A0A0B7FHE3_THACB|nr:hypothetical protein RSOLAG1IB_01620 [Rhizoctonia solani AG-1 IB]
MAATKENPIILYDIPDSNGASWSPNPYKTRLSLNYKGLPYRIEYVAFPEIEPKMKELGVTPVSNTFPRYTLPVIADPPNGPNGKPTYVSDSFKIALYLDDKYPAPTYPAIFAPGTRSLQHILMTQHYPTMTSEIRLTMLPRMLHLFDTQSAEYLKRTRGDIFKPYPDDVIAQKWTDAREKFSALDKSAELNDGTKDVGPFVTGRMVSFIDFAVGSLVYWIKNVEGDNSVYLEQMLEWQGGRWKRHWEAIQTIENASTQVN